MIGGFGDVHPIVLSRVAYAFIAKGLALFNEERFEEAIEVFDELVDRFGQGAREFGLGWSIVIALSGKALTLTALDRNDEALLVLDELIMRYGDDENEDVQRMVMDARAWREALSEAAGPD